MAWYRAGSVTVTNGSPNIVGAGTDYVSNTNIGEVFLGPDGRVYEIAAVTSATQLTIIPPYQGPSGGGQVYGIQPTSSFARDLALAFGGFKNFYAGILDTVGQGMFPDGSNVAPGVRFANDQDTGIRRVGDNALALVTGGVDRVSFDGNGAAVAGRIVSSQTDVVGVQAPALGSSNASNAFFSIAQTYGLLAGSFGANGSSWLQSQRVDGNPAAYDMLLQPSGGKVLIGTATGGVGHVVQNNAAPAGGPIIDFRMSGGFTIAAVYAIDFNGVDGANPAAAAFKTGRSATGRSIATSGSINASGADYAEYMKKSDGCGPIAKGDVCGVDADGFLTRTWADVRSGFVVKTTNPGMVLGDDWTSDFRPRPEMPEALRVEPVLVLPPEPSPFFVAAHAAWVTECAAVRAAFTADHALWVTERSTHIAETTVWEAEVATWETDLEAIRQTVDRIAFCGQVPVNVTGVFAVGDYIIAVANGSGIKAIAVPEADITFDQYRRRIGKVWAVRDGRAWVDVQHG